MENVWGSNMDNEESLSIGDLIKKTASEVVQQTLPGYVYYEEYGVYYNHDLGYYYDAKTSLFYHIGTKRYFRFNAETNNYEEYKPQMWSKGYLQRRAANIFGLEVSSNFNSDEIEIAELLFELTSKCDLSASCVVRKHNFMLYSNEDSIFLDEVLSKESLAKLKNNIDVPNDFDDSDDEYAYEMKRRLIETESSSEAPCIRLMEFSGDNKRPILHIVTIVGATIGLNVSDDVKLSTSSNICLNNRALITIQYKNKKLDTKDDEHVYEIYRQQHQDKFINVKLNEIDLSPQSVKRIYHNDFLYIEITRDGHKLQWSILVHLHNGLNTCPGCEPGLYSDDSFSFADELSCKDETMHKKNWEYERRRVLRQIKRDYDIDDDADYSLQDNRRSKQKRHNHHQLAKFEDKGIYTKCLASPKPGTSTESVIPQKLLKGDLLKTTLNAANNTSIQSGNKGFQLLKSMGWSEGNGLGKHRQGPSCPVELVSKSRFDDNASLNSQERIAKSVNQKRKTIMEKTMERYKKTRIVDE